MQAYDTERRELMEALKLPDLTEILQKRSGEKSFCFSI